MAFPMGRAWAKFMPRVKIFGVSLNPGPFTVKEHVRHFVSLLVYHPHRILRSSSRSWPVSVRARRMPRTSLRSSACSTARPRTLHTGPCYLILCSALPDASPTAGWFVTQICSISRYSHGLLQTVMSTQLIGFSIGGIARRFLVSPPSMIWPANLVLCALFNTLHSQNYAGVGNRGGMSRERFFTCTFSGSDCGTKALCVYRCLPGRYRLVLEYASARRRASCKSLTCVF
jgi:hypothetical protein